MSNKGSSGRTVIDLRDPAPVVDRIRELAGSETDPGWIAGLLNREGVPAPSHRPWSPEDVVALLHPGHAASA
jgi:hypothetical protein